MAKSKKQPDSIPETFVSLEEASEFWDSHSTADYEDSMTDVHFDVDIQRRKFLVPIEGKLAKEIIAIGQKEGLVLETLVNLWLKEKLFERSNLR